MVNFESAKKAISGLLGNGNEIVDSVEVAIKERIVSPFYGYFMISFLIINWRLFFFTFFVDQKEIYEKTRLLKHELLNQLLAISHFDQILYFLLLPLLLSYLFTWIFPYATRIFYRKHIKNQVSLKLIELQELERKTAAEKKLVQEETSLLQELSEQSKEQENAIKTDPKILWEIEFQKLIGTYTYKKIPDLIKSIYDYDGYKEYGSFKLDTEFLVYLDTHGFIEFEASNQIRLTEKGRYIIGKFSEQKNKEDSGS